MPLLEAFALASGVVSLVNTIGNAIANAKANKLDAAAAKLDLEGAILSTRNEALGVDALRSQAREQLSVYEGATDLLRDSSFGALLDGVDLSGAVEGNDISDTAKMQFQNVVGMYDISNILAATRGQEGGTAARNAEQRLTEFRAYAGVQAGQADLLVQAVTNLDAAAETYADVLAQLEAMKEPGSSGGASAPPADGGGDEGEGPAGGAVSEPTEPPAATPGTGEPGGVTMTGNKGELVNEDTGTTKPGAKPPAAKPPAAAPSDQGDKPPEEGPSSNDLTDPKDIWSAPDTVPEPDQDKDGTPDAMDSDALDLLSPDRGDMSDEYIDELLDRYLGAGGQGGV